MTKRNNWDPDWLRKWNPAAIEPRREPTPEEIEQLKLIDAAVGAICLQKPIGSNPAPGKK